MRMIIHHPKFTADMWGHIPDMLNERDPRSAREQLDAGYRHGGGWRPFEGMTMHADRMTFPGDPGDAYLMLAEIQFRYERVVLFLHEWVAVIQRDGSFEVSRMD